jgi:general stress protein 26
MPSPPELEAKLWASLKSDMTLMLGLDHEPNGDFRPMTAQMEGDQGPLWFFTARDTELVQNIEKSNRATAIFASKGHDLFATIHGELEIDNDRAVINRLWNHFVAAWYPGGKDDPSLVLLRLNADHAKIWMNETSLLTSIKLFLGSDPKKEYKDKVATVNLS